MTSHPIGTGKLRLKSSLLLSVAWLCFNGTSSAAQAVNDPILNPDTGQNEIIIGVLPDGFFATDQGNTILTTPVGGQVTVDGIVFNITGQREAAGQQVYDLVEANPPSGDPAQTRTLPLVDNVAAPPSTGNPGDAGGPVPFTPPPGSQRVESKIAVGSRGADGRDGFGFEAFGVTVGRQATRGDDGGTGPTQTFVFDGAATSSGTANQTPGITVVSRGGQGGQGGDAVVSFNIDAAQGGRGGNGGTVNLTNRRQVSSGGILSHGLLAQSVAGKAGSGGSSFSLIVGAGGTGGPPSAGGTVNVTNEGQIQVTGPNAAGIMGQSNGGAGGAGGSGFGIVGKGGAASQGGNGGTVNITNRGDITTGGAFGFGIIGQSIGGSGGNAGTAGAIVAFGGDAGTNSGGNAGSVTLRNETGGDILTTGSSAYGMIAQSIGGGGGTGGSAGGIVAFGGEGGGGGDAGSVELITETGSSIETRGDFSHGLVAQSIGGGGGIGGGSGGVVSFGGSGTAGGAAGTVTVNSNGTVTTQGELSKGIMAQSIGGGGGASAQSGGIVSLGGKSGAGGDGKQVTVSNGGTITTSGDDGDGVFAQSIGGGGGSASGTGAVFAAIGGSGGSGGSGGTVSVTNSGSIQTTGVDASGIHAQSIGGGGGSGGNASSGSVLVGVSVGGSGSAGGAGGTATVTLSPVSGSTPTIRTAGLNSEGIFVQSVGGGGGDGGRAINGTIGVFGGLSIGIGGDASNGGAGGTASLTGRGSIFTGTDPAVDGSNSDGIVVQSVGGGGGSGGAAIAATITGGIGGSAGISAGLGGSGGAGGAGGQVTVDSGGLIVTGQDLSTGLLAQSVGGGGGTGGYSVSAAVAGAGSGGALAVAVGLGGTGGSGGVGGTVNSTFDGDISTAGFDSDGALIQSIGGGGGAGGFSVAGALAGADIAAGSVAVGLGGNGGGGGNGGTVTGEVTGNVLTTQAQSDGVVVQSVGGGGGAGGFNAGGAIAGAGVGSGAASVGLGGAGGGAGSGGTVTGTYNGSMQTSGKLSRGVVVQSVGGGGGAGGFNANGAISGAGTGAAAVSVGLGGAAGDGGGSGPVTGAVSGSVTTQGDQSTAVLVQSVAGGGGAGGFSAGGAISGAGTAAGVVTVGLGGSGGDGGTSGTVDSTVNADLTTDGSFSNGLVVQSTGGGGGSGGFNAGGGISGAGAGAGSVSVGLGGSGGGGGTGGTVISRLTGSITTTGDLSTGVLVQSGGGGGGDGAFNATGAISGAGTGSGVVSVGIGGSGGGGGSGGVVTSTVNGNVTTGLTSGGITTGFGSKGIVVQSTGGGGGNGAFSATGGITGAGTGAGAVSVGVGGSGAGAGNGGAVTSTVTGNVVTAGVEAVGTTVQSIGGGGGNGGFSAGGALSGAGTGSGAVSVGVGGSGGGGGNGGTVQATQTGNITTSSQGATGLLVQSTGGGGGNGGFSAGGALSGAGTGAGAVSVGVGGSGGGGGTGGTVTSTFTGNVSTSADNARAVIVQSMGGGGGNGAFTAGGAISGAGTGAGVVAVGVGGSGGTGGQSGTVNSTFEGDVSTSGVESAAVTVQSIGGGGGTGGFSAQGALAGAGQGSGAVAIGVGGSGGGGGQAGNVTATQTGNIETTFARSGGFTVQSVGGGGGAGGFSATLGANISGQAGGSLGLGVGGFGGDGGDAGTVTATHNGDLETRGTDSNGVFVQSAGGGGGAGGFNITGGISLNKTGGGAAAIGVGGFGGDGGDGSDASLTRSGEALTLQDRSTAITVQSVGGGGGAGGFNISGAVSAAKSGSGSLSFGLGGFGGNGGRAGNVTATQTGKVETRGTAAGGILVQSAGGGGGAGGFDVAGAVSFAKTGAGTAAIGIGGFGGDGGASGTADLTLDGDVTTGQDQSTAVVVQSIAGGGGAGGLNVSGAITGAKDTGGSLGLGVGGFGGGGGDSDAVTAQITSDVTTSGFSSGGVVLQSQGGGGGNGGLNVSGAVTMTKDGSGAVALGLGGFGGGAGNAGSVTGTLDGTVTTTGVQSGGVLAQSTGGGGGNGGLNVSGAVAIASGDGATGSVGIGVGGFGGGGGNAGDVDITRIGSTTTSASGSDGIVLQSIGGSGGNGGVNVTGNVALSVGASGTAAGVGVGGFGGGGGNAGNVKGRITGDVIARGLLPDASDVSLAGLMGQTIGGASGVIAQSVGGGGGNGGVNFSGSLSVGLSDGTTNPAVSLGLGGFGGGAGNAGTVDFGIDADTVRANGTRNIVGVAAQSIGGAGGNGGVNVSGGISSSGNLTLGVGGFGGGGGTAGAVTASAETDITVTAVQDARGFVAQSIGGGGGNGGVNVSKGVTFGTINGARDQRTPTLVAGIGGFGGAGNRASTVDAIQSGDIVVRGGNSMGILSQSVGGGGGAGGINVAANIALTDGFNGVFGMGGNAGVGADAGNVTLTSDGFISVNGRSTLGIKADSGAPAANTDEARGFGDRANGILAQSVGGGGGDGGLNVVGLVSTNGTPAAVNVGGSGGAGGNAGSVTVTRGQTRRGLLQTAGDSAAGLVAQSVGGGGGNAGMAFLLTIGNQTSPNTGQSFEDGQNQINLQVGGDGGSAGVGSDVTVTHAGEIRTSGERSDAIIAQSVGGGGGNANFTVGLGRNAGGNQANITIGGGTGDGGESGDVRVTNTGTIKTIGADSRALLAQSVGGGGGNTATSMLLNLSANNAFNLVIGRDGGTGGAGGLVSVNSNASLSTQGDRATGLMAQSVGGGGGISSADSVGITAGGGTAQDTQTTVAVAVGRQGGSGGIGGVVDVTSGGQITTKGANADAIHAQSIGGGGGTGGSATAVIFDQSYGLGVGVGGTGGTGNNGGQVTVNNTATLSTAGLGATGIKAQSIGGGGGIGGYVVGLQTQIKSPRDGGARTAAVTVGGEGGTGGNGAQVDVTSAGQITTQGAEAHGIKAESIGGGGGDGGLVLNLGVSRTSASDNLTVAVGGRGGRGGTGAAVNATNEGTISTNGRGAAGIYAKSIGGGGGDASLITQLNFAKVSAGKSARRLAINVGGSGGSGAISGPVVVTNEETGVIETSGDEAHGIHALSVGGGGGLGSSVATLNIGAGGSKAGADSFIGGVSIGGSGGDGNTSGTVEVTNAGQISTSGDRADGIRAQSIGGGGGNGGAVLQAAILVGQGTLTPGQPQTPSFILGGSGGTGADAQTVTVTNTGSITTTGDAAHAIHAQSIGGGGGNANLALTASTGDFGISSAIADTVALGLGALQNASGGKGGDVTVNHSGDIRISGVGAQAIVAESINGGGGGLVLDLNGISGIPGGAALPGSPSGVTTDDPALVIFSGASGASSGPAGVVTTNTTGTIIAEGASAGGMRLQGVNGGGGDTLVLLSTAAPDAGQTPIEIQTRLGGTEGTGNVGSDINGEHDGAIGTTGAASIGAFAQSVGSGGGRTVLALDTSSGGAVGPIGAELGASGGQDSSGGAVDLSQQGVIQTMGDLSVGFMAQSVGGGGGLMALSDTSAATAASTQVQTPAAGMPVAPLAAVLNPALSVQGTLGGDGASGADGGVVDITRSGDISTSGFGAIGLVAQSVGGGGGVLALSHTATSDVTFGGAGGASGNGDAVNVTNNGAIYTRGTAAHGIVVQSVGGGGGLVIGSTSSSSSSARAANSGDGAAVTLAQNGEVSVSGANAVGITAQSVGGGGGFGGQSGFAGSAGGSGQAGPVTVTAASNVLATGDGGMAIVARSDAGTGGSGGDITVALNNSMTVVGGAGGVGVAFAGGAANTLTNSGALATVDGITGLAFAATDGDDALQNDGLVQGNVQLGTGTNAFHNRQASSRFEAGQTIDLGASGNQMTNAGQLALGGTGTVSTVQTSALSGSYAQSETGVMELDLDFVSGDAEVGRIDRLDATGRLTFDGFADLRIVNPGAASPGTRDVVFGTGVLGADLGTLALAAPISAVADYKLIQQSSSAVALRYNIDFAPGGNATANQAEVGEYINRVQIAGGSPALSPLIATFFGIPDSETLSLVYSQLDAEAYAVGVQASVQWSSSSMGSALQQVASEGNPAIAGSWSNPNSTVKRRRSLDVPPSDARVRTWGTVKRLKSIFDGSFENASYDLSGSQVQVGVMSDLQEDLTVGAFVSYGSFGGQVDGSAGLEDGETGQLGVLARRSWGDISLTGALSFGQSALTVNRNVGLPNDLGGAASGRQKIQSIALKGRLERTMADTWGQATLSLDLDAIHTHQRGFVESGGGLGQLRIEDRSDWHVFVSPALAFSNSFSDGRTTYVPHTRVGLTHRLFDDPAVSGGLAAAPLGVSPFESFANVGDRTTLNVDVGLDVFDDRGQALRLNASAQIGEYVRRSQVGVSYELKF